MGESRLTRVDNAAFMGMHSELIKDKQDYKIKDSHLLIEIRGEESIYINLEVSKKIIHNSVHVQVETVALEPKVNFLVAKLRVNLRVVKILVHLVIQHIKQVGKVDIQDWVYPDHIDFVFVQQNKKEV